MKYVSLFAGIGGFDLALNRLGHSCVYSNEWDKYSADTYEKNFKHRPDTRDITTVPTSDIPDHDILVGGFPCQAFSIAGKRLGLNDTRGTLFYEIGRILNTKRPSLILLENVKGLLSHDNGRTFQTIMRTFDELGYDLQWQVLNSKNFGVPQNRERVYIVGHLRGQSRPQVFPFGSNSAEDSKVHKREGEIASTINATYSRNQSDAQYVSLDGKIRRLTPTECERLQGFPDGWTAGVSDTQRYKQLGNAVTVNVVYEVAKRLGGDIYG